MVIRGETRGGGAGAEVIDLAYHCDRKEGDETEFLDLLDRCLFRCRQSAELVDGGSSENAT
jgi:hypothetical protein